MATGKSPGRGAGKKTKTKEKTADDLKKIAAYLDTQRAETSDRNATLARDLVARRPNALARSETPRDVGKAQEASSARKKQSSVKEQAAQFREARGLVSERYHSFCNDLDTMLNTFQHRTAASKPTHH